MDIVKIDKNFDNSKIDNFNEKVYKLPSPNFNIFGGYYDNEYGFIKMPAQIADKISEGVSWGSKCTAGVRVLFSTDSKNIKVQARLYAKCMMHHMTLVGSASLTLKEVTSDSEIFVENFFHHLIKTTT